MDQTNVPSSVPAPAGNYQFPSSGEMFKQAWEVYKKHGSTLISISVLPIALVFIGSFLLGAAGAVTTMPNGDVVATGTAGVIAALITAVIVIYFSILSFAALVHYIIFALGNEEAITFKQAFQNSYDDVIPLLWTGILCFLAVLGGLILLIVPGIIFAFWFSQGTYIVITEKLKGKAALKQSKLYVKGNVGQIFKKGFFILIIVLAVALGGAIIFGIIDGLLNTNAVGLIGEVILRILIAPFAAVYTFLLFRQLKNSKS